MRIEEIAEDYERSQRFLNRLYKYLNVNCFGNTLPGAALGFGMGTFHYTDDNGILQVNAGEYIPSLDISLYPDHIEISFDFIHSCLAIQKTQKDQVYLLALVMLHEMMHQYWYRVLGHERGSDFTHSQEWQDECKKHGLINVYVEGKQVDERLEEFFAYFICSDIRIR